MKTASSASGFGIIALAAIVGVGIFAWSHLSHKDTSKTWWNGTLSLKVCPVGNNANNFPGADTGNDIGCRFARVTSEACKITKMNDSLVQGAACGKVTQRYCDFYDLQDKQWEVTQ